MASLFKLVGEIVINNDNANSEIDETVKKAASAESSISESFSKIGKSCLKIGGYVTTAAVAVGSYLFNVAENTREYRTEIGKLETAFTSSGHSVETAKNTFKELQSVLGDTGQAVEAASNLAKLTTNEQELAEWTNICVGAFASFGGISISGLTESVNETAKVGQISGDSLANALSWAGASSDELNSKLSACSTEQERQQVILETLNGLYASAAERYRETNAEIIASNTAHNNLNAAMAGLGAAAEPAVTVLVNAAAKIAEAVTPVVEALADAVVALGDAWVTLSEKMKDITASITVHTNGVSTAAAGVGAAVTEATGSGFWGTLADNFVKNSAVNPDAPWFSWPGFATGLDYVPYDDFPARLHEGEAVLTRQEAGEWRNSGDIASAVRDAMSGIQFNVMLDSGVLVGQLAPQMDMRLGTISGRKGRGN